MKFVMPLRRVPLTDPDHLWIFQRQVAFQLRAVLFGAEDVNAALRSMDSNREAGFERLWFAIQNMLTAAANVSKACWGQSGRLSEARKPLRDSLGISDESPLLPTSMRNHFEHYDERLDEWQEESTDHNYGDMNIAMQANFVGEIDSFRELDPGAMVVSFWGDKYDLGALVAEAERLLPVAEGLASTPPGFR